MSCSLRGRQAGRQAATLRGGGAPGALTRGRADQHVFVAAERCLEDSGLDSVERLVAAERELRPLGQRGDLRSMDMGDSFRPRVCSRACPGWQAGKRPHLDDLLVGGRRGLRHRRHPDLLISLECPASREGVHELGRTPALLAAAAELQALIWGGSNVQRHHKPPVSTNKGPHCSRASLFRFAGEREGRREAPASELVLHRQPRLAAERAALTCERCPWAGSP
jgi:hypothetical protein